ncbi:helix-turn-helix transcriptional regulator [Bradyrhizobium jicamae]|uniref:Helix-turn-helix transcriptional regulator n=1 Tax=Bradyrhizobium jicamae TaxID=280332 RepID=A0ABS5FWQ9_9BRAD|nr:AraC family transcriptional regulator [Bradyrhizobium jicamae]MBR0800994.1 helix-turn-helix transcriptional regulator [Bradyrhizobium jicamae]
MTGLSSGGSRLLNPEQRMAMVPVTCAAHSGGFGWRGMRVEDYPDLPPSDIRCAGMNAHLLVYHTRALDGEFHHECADRTTRTRLRSGELSFIPARADNRWLFGEGRPCAIHVMIDEDLFTRNVAQDGCNSPRDLRDDFQFTSPELQALVRLFALELANGGLNGPLYVEALGAALSHRIMREFGAPPPATNQGGPALDRAIELIHQEYYRAIGLDELAGLTGLSRAQFIRRFRAAFGKAPHAYLIDYRIAIARQRLRMPKPVSLVDLALELGFADQSHFHRHFRALTGASPAAFRRSRLT